MNLIETAKNILEGKEVLVEEAPKCEYTKEPITATITKIMKESNDSD